MRSLNKGIILFILLFVSLAILLRMEVMQESNRAGILLTFDDHSIDDWLAAQPLFDKYNAKATYFVNFLGDLSDEELAGVQSLYSKGNEIGSHGWKHLSATNYLKNHSIDEYIQEEIVPTIEKLKELGIEPKSFSYPYGVSAKGLDQALFHYFRTIRGTAYLRPGQSIKELDKIYYDLHQPHSTIYAIGLDESYGYSDEDIMEALQYAVDTERIVMFYGHRIDLTNQGVEGCTRGDRLEKILQFAKDHNMSYYTAEELNR